MTLVTSLRPARPGFTLVELLVVISIIAVLLAITGVAIQKTVEGQKNRNSKDQVYKLQQSLDAEYKRVLDKCESDATSKRIPQPVMDYCEGDMNRAKAVWLAMNLRQQFPDSFYEAVNSYTVSNSNGTSYTLKPSPAFTTAIGSVGTASSPSPTAVPAEQAALLYLILANKSVAGGGAMATSADELGQQTNLTIGGRPFKAFVDGWGQPVLFARAFGTGYVNHPAESELQTDPQYYGSVNQFNNANHDPLDPRNVVLGWADTTKRGQMAAKQPSGLSFNGLNRTLTVYSLGKNPADPSDDVLGYHLRRFGQSR